MPGFFDEHGDEYQPAPALAGKLAQHAEIGGSPETTDITISVYSEQLDKERVMRLLVVNPMSRRSLKPVAERNLNFTFDVYFEDEKDSE